MSGRDDDLKNKQEVTERIDRGTAYFRRYQITKQLEDLNYALELWQEATTLPFPDPATQFDLLNNLGIGLHERFGHTDEIADLERAIQAWQQALELTLPDSPARFGLLNSLGDGLREYYLHTGELERCTKELSYAILQA